MQGDQCARVPDRMLQLCGSRVGDLESSDNMRGGLLRNNLKGEDAVMHAGWGSDLLWQERGQGVIEAFEVEDLKESWEMEGGKAVEEEGWEAGEGGSILSRASVAVVAVGKVMVGVEKERAEAGILSRASVAVVEVGKVMVGVESAEAGTVVEVGKVMVEAGAVVEVEERAEAGTVTVVVGKVEERAEAGAVAVVRSPTAAST